MDEAGNEQRIRDSVTRGELQANNNKTAPTIPSTYTNNSQVQTTPPLSQVQVAQPSPTDSQSVLNGVPTIPPMAPQTQTHSALMVMVTPSPTVHSSTMTVSMDNGPNMLLHHLMSNASVQSVIAHHASPNGSESLTIIYNGHKYQVPKIKNTIYQISQQDQMVRYSGALVDSGVWPGLILVSFPPFLTHMLILLELAGMLWNGCHLCNVPLL